MVATKEVGHAIASGRNTSGASSVATQQQELAEAIVTLLHQLDGFKGVSTP